MGLNCVETHYNAHSRKNGFTTLTCTHNFTLENMKMVVLTDVLCLCGQDLG